MVVYGENVSFHTRYFNFVWPAFCVHRTFKRHEIVKIHIITETVILDTLRWFWHIQRIEGNRIPKGVSYMDLEATRLGGRPWNRWQDEVREDGRIVGGEGWQEKVYNREEWKKLLRTARTVIFICLFLFSTLTVVSLTDQLTALTHRCICSGDSNRQFHYIPSPCAISQVST
jgi:hypothetical protein